MFKKDRAIFIGIETNIRYFHLLIKSQGKMSILYSHFIIRKAKNISSFGEKVVWNYQILEEIRNVNNVTPSLYNTKKMRPRKRKFLTCLRSQSYSKTTS